MEAAATPGLAAAVRSGRKRTPGAGVTPGGGGSIGGDQPSLVEDPNWEPAYSGTTPPTFPFTDDGHGTRFIFTDGSFEANGRREPTPGDSARMTFILPGATHVWDPGRIDGSDRYEMNQDDDAYDGSRNGIGSGYRQRPAMLNSLILTGVTLKDTSADPAVFPGTDGPHLHSFAQQSQGYWTDARLEGDVAGDGVSLTKDWVGTAMERSAGGFNVQTSIVPYWPTFRHELQNNNRAHTGYIGRPRGVAGIPNAQLPLYEGNVIPFPQGLRMFTFKTGFFKPGGSASENWEFVAAFPMCWNGTDLWLPEGAHMAFLNSDGTPPSTHPFVLPMIHWFATIEGTASKTKAEMENFQSAQATDPDPAAIIDGERRDYWNYNNTHVDTHMECLVAFDPVMAEAVAWMVNNYAGLGRVKEGGA